MGRLTLNILLSFAQFEREIIGERTRDKLSAARRKGKWIGGVPVLGYDVAPAGGRLLVNAAEAERVRDECGVRTHAAACLLPLGHTASLDRRAGWNPLGMLLTGSRSAWCSTQETGDSVTWTSASHQPLNGAGGSPGRLGVRTEGTQLSGTGGDRTGQPSAAQSDSATDPSGS